MEKLLSACARICTLLLAAAITTSEPGPEAQTPQVRFVDVAPQAGLTVRMISGGEKTKKYIWESTGSGIAAFDYDGDGYPAILILSGSTLEGVPKESEPVDDSYHKNRDGIFADFIT